MLGINEVELWLCKQHTNKKLVVFKLYLNNYLGSEPLELKNLVLP